MRDIVIFGSGGHCKVVIDIIEKSNQYNILGLIDPFKEIGTEVLGYRVLGDIHSINKLSININGGIVAIGDNWSRYKTVTEIVSIHKNFRFITAIHPSAIIGKNTSINEGTVIMANSVINSGTTIGQHCIINTNSSVDHDCTLHDFVNISPGAILGGNVKVGKQSVISLGANIIHNISIGDHTVIGAGSTVLKDIGSNTIAYGTPAVFIRKREACESYL